MSRSKLEDGTTTEAVAVAPRDGWAARFLPYVPSVGGWRRSTRGQRAVVRGRARADRDLLTAFAALVVLAAALAAAVPRQMARTVDGGARHAVQAGGTAADVDVRFVARWVANDAGFGASDGTGDATTLGEIRDAAQDALRATPDDLAVMLSPMTVSALSEPLRVRELRDPGPGKARPTVAMIARVGWADPETGGSLTWLAGQPPTVAPVTALHNPVIPVAVSEAAAAAWDLAPGVRMTVAQTGSGRSTLLITGIFRVDEPDSAVWRTLDSVQAPVPRDPDRVGANVDEITFLADGDALAVAEAGLGNNGMTVHLRRPLDVDAVTGQRLRDVRSLLRSYADDELSPLPSDSSADFVSTLPSIAAAYAVQARAVLAQLSVAVAAVIGVGLVVLLLGAQLLTRRRRVDLSLQHARGASLTAIGTGLLLESLLITGPALLLGAGLGIALTPHARAGAGPWLLVAVLTLLLGPVLGMLTARAAWATRRTPANRRARGRAGAERAMRRVVVELVAVAVAVAAVVSLRTRGLSGATFGVDPLLAAAPLLLTAAVTVVVMRVYPWPVRLAAALARRRPGAMPVVAAARARTALSWSPLLALTLAIGLMVGTGLLRTTLLEGQQAASWQRIGADVRVALNKAPLTDTQLEALSLAPGVTAACRGFVGNGWTSIGASNSIFTAIVVDGDCYQRVLTASGLGTAPELARLGTPMPDGSMRAVLTGDVSWPPGAVDLKIGDSPLLKATAVGRASLPPAGWQPGPVVILDATATRSAGWRNTDTTLWVAGPGARAAVDAQPQVPGWDLHDRREWLTARTSGGVIADMGTLLVVALVVLALLAAIAMVQTVSAGAAERGLAVSLLRTLGLTMREGRWLTLSELLPLVVVGVAAGAASGFGLVVLLVPSLGLEQVTGGIDRPALRLAPSWAVGVMVAALAVVVIAAVVESLLQRTQRLASVLRVGQTR